MVFGPGVSSVLPAAPATALSSPAWPADGIPPSLAIEPPVLPVEPPLEPAVPVEPPLGSSSPPIPLAPPPLGDDDLSLPQALLSTHATKTAQRIPRARMYVS